MNFGLLFSKKIFVMNWYFLKNNDGLDRETQINIFFLVKKN